MKMPTLTDSRGNPSTTLALVALSWLSATIVFLWKGGPGDIGSYGAACIAILTPWIAREVSEKMIKDA